MPGCTVPNGGVIAEKSEMRYIWIYIKLSLLFGIESKLRLSNSETGQHRDVDLYSDISGDAFSRQISFVHAPLRC